MILATPAKIDGLISPQLLRPSKVQPSIIGSIAMNRIGLLGLLILLTGTILSDAIEVARMLTRPGKRMMRMGKSVMRKGKGMMHGKGKKGSSKTNPPKPTGRRSTATPTPFPLKNATLIYNSTGDLEVVACDATSVEVQGSQAGSLSPGSYFIYLEGGDAGCNGCSPLYRYIEATSLLSSGKTLLTTRFATAGEVLGEMVGANVTFQPLEPLAGCPHSGPTAAAFALSATAGSVTTPEGCTKEPCRALQVSPRQLFQQGDCKSAWLQKNADGRCTFTNCFVGETGDPNNCFWCKTTCDNGCGGRDSWLKFNGDFGFYDFGPACCNHDHCWSSTKRKLTCDVDFYIQMAAECPPLPVVVVALLLPLSTPYQAVLLSCHLLATSFFLIVHYIEDSYKIAQERQRKHEKEDVCVAKCPSTQRSGGQGTTVLTIDLKVPNGTFPISYQMYSIPDQLYIDYEGKRIFDTGGLVSGSGASDVTYAGIGKLIQVTINAPNDGTVWDVSVGCPYGLSP
jgi:hypothetical protein